MSDNLEELIRHDIRVCMDEHNVICVSKENKIYYYGYDIITEQFIKMKKDSAIEMPKVILNLINNKFARLKLSNHLCPSVDKSAKLMRMGKKTLFRLNKEMEEAYGQNG
ncbi:MAG TPA: hypothetical protein VN026_11510 [Bacteroidia bacterium]|jgi:hypothetical protein|nr:hypothetical protein [Bacteroidia bacterium]